MELLPGGTVWSRFGGNGFTLPAACATVLAASAGLQAAHEKNVLHRDVKPENLMFSSEGVLKVTDFGIAKVVGGDSTLATRAGEVLGTPAYIAPEQARGPGFLPRPTSTPWPPCCTSFSPGSFLFRRTGTPWRCCSSTRTEDPTPLDQKAANVPSPVVPVVMRGLATAPEDRYESAESFAIALAEACTSVWGPGWLAAEGVPVMGAGSSWPPQSTSACPRPAKRLVQPRRRLSVGKPRGLQGALRRSVSHPRRLFSGLAPRSSGPPRRSALVPPG